MKENIKNMLIGASITLNIILIVVVPVLWRDHNYFIAQGKQLEMKSTSLEKEIIEVKKVNLELTGLLYKNQRTEDSLNRKPQYNYAYIPKDTMIGGN